MENILNEKEEMLKNKMFEIVEEEDLKREKLLNLIENKEFILNMKKKKSIRNFKSCSR